MSCSPDPRRSRYLLAALLASGACFRGAAPRGDDADAVLQPASSAQLAPDMTVRYAIDIVSKAIGEEPSYERILADDLVKVTRIDDRIMTEEHIERAFGESDSSRGWSNLEHTSVESHFDRHGHLLIDGIADDKGRRIREHDTLEDTPFQRPLFRFSYAPPVPVRVGDVWTRERVSALGVLDVQWAQTTYQLIQLGRCQEARRCATIAMSSRIELEPEPGVREGAAVVQTRGEYVVDARSLHLLRARSEQAISLSDGTRRTLTVSVERRTQPSQRPPQMSPGVATLQVVAIPRARVAIDGQVDVTAPVSIKLPTGRHVVRVSSAQAQQDETIEVVLEDARAVTIYRNWCNGTPIAMIEACRGFERWH
jgi:hypothetical protein